MLEYLQEKTNAEATVKRSELELRKEELQLAQARLALEKQQFELDRQERQQRMEFDNKERVLMMRLLTEKLLQ